MKKYDNIFLIFVLALCAYVGITAMGYPKATIESGFGPGFYPLILVSILIFLCIVQFIVTNNPKKQNDESKRILLASIIIPVIFIISNIIFVLFFSTLGFIISAFMLLVINMRAMKLEWKKNIPISLGTTLIIYAVFSMVLRVPLPKGILRGLL